MGEAKLPKRLTEGYENFLNGRFPRERERFEELAERGQSPEILLIGCCDSRVSPELIFDAGPGEMFVVRNVANLVPPYKPNDDYHGTSAAIEFAVMGLKVKDIVVMGHAQCGGVKAFAEMQRDPYMRPLAPGDFIGRWIKLLAPAAESIGESTEPLHVWAERLAWESIRQSVANLRSFPYIATLEQRGWLNLHGAYFGVAGGELMALDPSDGGFRQVAAEAHREAFARTPRF
ncbi:carbonic anhydrase [Rhodoblastus acidophilus]|uniref:Carbonic anhydrase n=1 Tax=Candidatus Rhodoblastus alkanivorans TaxID=2954117 RepID=A0ABS9Z1S8_9HYPH|nr:carbonic anhydrase [Candidatus Rhodoblastus alkanivorans]MCI4678081.1 carbonic anhydrase [Candidatus Rhodoblastus alkanivorans]MCI4681578.1 carbonic anhydrase [Candidatus Rhodoblastus alkanivorans]MDI4642626.1 carbonic anhydrase [Rhodoblastus acidophilus]